MACKKDHSAIQGVMRTLPTDQGKIGRHKCAACAYEQGYQDGLVLKESIDLTVLFQSLDDSQAKEQRHKSPHAAYAQGYFNGVQEYYK